jgi:hypothetical protein
MIPFDGHELGPELLAAYFDGELDRCASSGPLKAKVEAWLAAHPEARAELESFRRLRQAWAESAPTEPESTTWKALLSRIESLPQAARARPGTSRGRVGWVAALLVATAAAVLVAVSLLRPGAGDPGIPNQHAGPPPEDMVEPLPVATAAEVEILRVGGDDTQSVVVGRLPVDGPLEWATRKDVDLTSVRPDPRDNTGPRVRIGTQAATPMIWSRADTDPAEEP